MKDILIDLKRPNVKFIRDQFASQMELQKFTIDKTGEKTIEILGASFLANEPSIFGKVSHEYVEREISWYESQSLNINDIYGPSSPPPKAWTYAANDKGEINSNYGKLIFSKEYHDQYNNVFQELKTKKDSRRAVMIYNRPSMWLEYWLHDKNDFICTNAVSYYIRNDKLHCVVQMRSNDAIFGYKNDKAWQDYVLTNLAADLQVDIGNMYWQVQNLHVYEKHFDLVNHYIETGEIHK